MEIEKLVSNDIWLIIKDNYEKGSYTTAITNLIQYVNEIVREKSGLSFDNTKLMEVAFLGSNPKLKINKFQTDIEKDIQAGVGYFLKGICLGVRNPRAHERYNDKKETADKIILFIDYVLGFVRDSKQPVLVEDWLEFVFDENFNNTKEYAEIVLKEIPDKNKYSLLVSIFRNREKAKQNSLNNLIKALLNIIKPDEVTEFYDSLNKELLFSSDNKSLRMFFSLFPPEKWECLIPLAKLKIENMVQKSIEEGAMYYKHYEFDDPDYICNSQGALSTWAVKFINFFDTKEKIIKTFNNRISNEDVNVRNFVIKYFGSIVFDDEIMKSEQLKYGIKKSLKYFDKVTFDNVDYLYDLVGDEEIKQLFEKEYEIAKEHFNAEDSEIEMPF